MVLGLIQVESAFRKYAMSIVGARGYMQVMPFWTRVIGDSDHSKLFQMQANLRYGCAILRMYIDMEGGICTWPWVAITAAAAGRIIRMRCWRPGNVGNTDGLMRFVKTKNAHMASAVWRFCFNTRRR